ncbi:MAG: hypothetical protein KTU85_10935 [Acidimicrobiia bacterium]|nr:hypothetical protein [Acidimicrobiia bacterium]MCY4457846.1 hypothetical protein [Acidimicrobiaceae bacterium]
MIKPQIRPEPTSEEAAAIFAAYEALWPQQNTTAVPQTTSPWRFSGRQWLRLRKFGGWSRHQ